MESKFKQGDEVVDILTGDVGVVVGEVIGEDSRAWDVKWKSGIIAGSTCWHWEDQLELVGKFKIGAKVCVKENPSERGVIVSRYSNEGEWYVEWDNTGYVLWIREDQLDIVEEKHTPLQQTIQGWNEIVINNGVVTELKHCDEPTSKITSTGGSSDYYKLIINGNHVETEDVIYAMVGGDFALGNALKALRRMYLDSEGGGKEGVDMSYDANKVKYFVDSFVKRFGD